MFKKLPGETAEADTVSRDEWLEDQWGQMRQEYTEENIQNTNESGICFQTPPDRALTFKSDNKKRRERNLRTGSPLSLPVLPPGKRRNFVTGKSQDPRCFKNVRTLPVCYKAKANATAWMTGNHFVRCGVGSQHRHPS